MFDKIAILDFGSQYTHLIARRVRELNVRSVVYPFSVNPEDIDDSRGIILSGAPWSVYKDNAPLPKKEIFKLGVPVLGICYGLQVIAHLFNGKVSGSDSREYGKALFKPLDNNLFYGLHSPTSVWMSHGDKLTELPENFRAIGSTDNSPFAAITADNIYGLQFHPEVTHTEEGMKVLKNFLYRICEVRGDWEPSSYLDIARKEIESKCETGTAILAYSGGVDSTVCSVIAKKIMRERFLPVFVDTGFMREGEAEEIKNIGKELGLGVKVISAERQFLNSLKDISDPEEKRKVIGREFIKVFEKEARKIDADYLIQGTLYPDRIESIEDVGPSHLIKTHHNVGGLPEKLDLKLVEPLSEFFKDEVRDIADTLNIPGKIYRRHPFPGPGLAVRILGKITVERLEMLRKADRILIDKLKEFNIYDEIWQAFCVFIPVRTVGVVGDQRTYGNVIGIRAVESEDGMTADWFQFKKKHIDEVARNIMNEVRGINRVVYDISSKPPATIEWE